MKSYLVLFAIFAMLSLAFCQNGSLSDPFTTRIACSPIPLVCRVDCYINTPEPRGICPAGKECCRLKI